MERGERNRENARQPEGPTWRRERRPRNDLGQLNMAAVQRNQGAAGMGSSGSSTPDYDAIMPFESSLPFVIACLIGALVTGAVWVNSQSRWSLATTVVLVLVGVGAFVADQLVVTDREYLQTLFSRLAIAAERQDVATICQSLDPELRPLREASEQVLKRVRPTEVTITKLDVSIDPAKRPLQATAAMIVRVTGDVIEKGNQGTVLAGVKVLLHKKDGVWLIKDAEVEKAKPGHDL